MIEKHTAALKIALHGMVGRTIRTMRMFLQRSCVAAAYVIVDKAVDADVDIFDGDLPASKTLIEKRLQENKKPVIVFSLQAFVRESVLHVKNLSMPAKC